MANTDIFAPAITRRAFFVCAALALALAVYSAPPPTKQGPLAQIGKPDATEAARLIEQFRQWDIAGQYYLEFELHELPRRGAERVYQGKLWGSRNARGPITRIALTGADGGERRLLLQNGEQSALWRLEGGRVVPLGLSAWFEPVVPGVELTAFDLEMPFLYWPGATVDKIERVRGRPANQFVFRPPPAVAAQFPQLTGARAYLDTQFNKPLQTELLGRDGAVLKTLSLVDLKKIGEQWMVKSLDVRDETTRDKTRVLVTGAALNLALAPAVFEPAALADDVLPPPAGLITSLAP
jgi:hypothetical protein